MTEHVTPEPQPAYSAVIKQDGKWWIGWIEEIPGVNCQEETRETTLPDRDYYLEDKDRFQTTLDRKSVV